MKKIKIAILDLYNGISNQGMRSIKNIIEEQAQVLNLPFEYHVYDVRAKNEVPQLSDYNIYISSGGPGSPFEGEGHLWEKKYFHWLAALWDFNQKNQDQKKYAFFICHSFQMITRFFEIGNVCLRKSVSFGILPTYKTEMGEKDVFLQGLDNPFYIVDNRLWQVIEPNDRKLAELGAEILALEKPRPHVDLERAMMALRISPEIFAAQFHPEADPQGMAKYMLFDEVKKAEIIENYGQEKYDSMVHQLYDPEKIILTRQTIIPSFLQKSVENLIKIEV
jgi:GMP synthase-like glutamine amidotransferase